MSNCCECNSIEQKKNVKVIHHIYHLKHGEESAVEESNLIPGRGEPIVVYREDGTTGLKIGDGKTPVTELDYIGNDVDEETIKRLIDEEIKKVLPTDAYNWEEL